jgi:SPP1 family predicted phage head-tail adaptor
MTIWAEAITTGGREFYAAQKLYAEMTVLFRVRYNRKYYRINEDKIRKQDAADTWETYG